MSVTIKYLNPLQTVIADGVKARKDLKSLEAVLHTKKLSQFSKADVFEELFNQIDDAAKGNPNTRIPLTAATKDKAEYQALLQAVVKSDVPELQRQIRSNPKAFATKLVNLLAALSENEQR